MELCSHGRPMDEICVECEFEREQADLEAQRADPYGSMAFGDAIRFEEECIANDMSMGEFNELFPDYPEEDFE